MPQGLAEGGAGRAVQGLTEALALSPLQAAAIFGGMFLGGISKGIIGIALPVIAIAVMGSVVEPHRVIGIMVFPILTTNAWLALHQGRAALAEPWPLVVVCLVTMLVTSLFARDYPERLILFALGFVMLLFVTVKQFTPHLDLPPRWVRPAGMVAGFFSGLLGGATSIYGAPINIYFVALKLDKSMWLRSIGLTYSLCGLPLLVGYGLNGILNASTTALSLIACLPAFLGTWVGLKLQRHVSPAAFQKIVLIALFLAGLNFLRRALM